MEAEARLRAPMSRVLIIDDDAALLDVLALAFEDAGYGVLAAMDGTKGLEVIQAEGPDAVVSDVNMPGLDGFTLCRRLRAAGNEVPFILLTSRDNEIDEALGFELGADDYVSKPFSTRILLARVQALLRRRAVLSGEAASGHRRRVLGALELDPDRLEARYRGTQVRLTVSEFKVLEALAARPGVVLSRQQILDRVRGDESVVAERIVDTYVRVLRRKLEAVDPAFGALETVVGAGYRYRHE